MASSFASDQAPQPGAGWAINRLSARSGRPFGARNPNLGGDVALSLYDPGGWPELLSPAQVAKLVNITPGTVGRWCEEGTIEALKIGRVWRIPREAVWTLVDSPSIRAHWPEGPWKEQPEPEP